MNSSISKLSITPTETAASYNNFVTSGSPLPRTKQYGHRIRMNLLSLLAFEQRSIEVTEHDLAAHPNHNNSRTTNNGANHVDLEIGRLVASTQKIL